RSLDHLWDAWTGDLRARAGTPNQRANVWREHGQWANGALRRVYPRAAHPAADHRQCARSGPRRARVAAPGELWARRDAVADHLASRVAERDARHPDRHD